MERLTRPTVEVDETAAKYMGRFPLDLRTCGDWLIETVLNWPTLYGLDKPTLRKIIRQLYGALKAYEDIGLEPWEIEQTLANFSSFLMEMTGGRMSKTNYTVQAMVSEAIDHFERICDECRERVVETESNEPLTLDDLRQMEEATPVWMENEKHGGMWCLAQAGVIMMPSGVCYDAGIFGWRLYRRKPEVAKE